MEKKNTKGYTIEDGVTYMVEEPVQAYVSSQSSQPVLAWRLLGGRRFLPERPVSGFDYYDAGVRGIPKSSITELASVLRVPMKDMADLLNVSYKTIGRKKETDILDSWVSSHSIEIANAVARGLSVFGDVDKFNRWLQKPNKALRGQKPFELLKFPTGIKLINQVLGRIEEGVYT